MFHRSSILMQILFILCTLLLLVSCRPYEIRKSGGAESLELSRPSQFQMDVYSRPSRRGTVQRIRSKRKRSVSTPCWNLQSKHVGSIDLNDPLTKITFYRSPECQGAPVRVLQGTSTKQLNIKARSVKVVRIRPIYFSTPEDSS
ncbi:hypothetical protein J3Q64DRAFT_1707873 [Phycomyces blakesleeanus]|uniref:Secreted effector protein n=2 Tax=Phycomyces blakesleeanus TaxID=4837 RepID=A0A162XZ84_PHYB8|nr:hypothetical protein PHYBLDRAFT_185488 [Phycomyces blakesleeanus NRRL 1555(-)]OAD77425.1 hypothetical protein PHYBLDRAFT_185488 [Phycomyces blakesleeanus NRRL 1555(-)]|eukprot:XP_018295465.1 hypothetical protein PHYBLDRAFT_185488 [Phycomyces blakesleeanus NRRL 1555(-)]